VDGNNIPTFPPLPLINSSSPGSLVGWLCCGTWGVGRPLLSDLWNRWRRVYRRYKMGVF
jgi:hypothetical protein